MRHLASILIMAAVALACTPAGPSAEPTAPPSASPSTAGSSRSPSVAPSASTSASTSAGAQDLTAGPLAAGTYTRAGFEPGVTFSVADGWTTGTLAPGFFDVQQQSGTPDVIAVQFGNVDGLVGEGGATEDATTVEAAIDAIKANPGIEVDGESESLLGGQRGVVVEVENTGSAHAPILDVPPGRLGIDPGRRLWVALFDTSNGLLAVMVGGPIDDWDAALEVAEPVLESIVIDD